MKARTEHGGSDETANPPLPGLSGTCRYEVMFRRERFDKTRRREKMRQRRPITEVFGPAMVCGDDPRGLWSKVKTPEQMT